MAVGYRQSKHVAFFANKLLTAQDSAHADHHESEDRRWIDVRRFVLFIIKQIY
jgi:hypothetical protein